MSLFSIQEAQDLVAFATQTSERLTVASARFDTEHDALAEERGWLLVATRRLSEALELVRAALLEAAALPEFANARKVKSETLANAWADAIEGVFDAIVAKVSANGPLIEALFPHQRFASLRRPGSAAHNFWLEFERRADSGYVRRLCADSEYQFLLPLLEAAKASERAVREAASPPALPEAQSDALRAQVSAAAEALELALRQSRLLSEAAFAATPSAVSELGLDAKPKRRAKSAQEPKLAPS